MKLLTTPFANATAVAATLAVIAVAGRSSAVAGLIATNLFLIWIWLALPGLSTGPRQVTPLA